MDEILYKYQGTRVGIDRILSDSTLRFTPPSLLNDPFEAGPRIVGKVLDQLLANLPSLIRSVDGPGLDTQLAEEVLRVKLLREAPTPRIDSIFGVLSLSRRCDSLLMWSHYAEQHKGIVVGLRANHLFFQPGNAIAKDGLREVRYREDRPTVNMDSLGDMDMANEALLFTKSSDWSYEQEVRVIRNAMSPSLQGAPKGIVEFPTDLVAEIIIGARTPAEDIGAVFDIHERKYPSARLMMANFSEREYGLAISSAFPKLFLQLIRGALKAANPQQAKLISPQ